MSNSALALGVDKLRAFLPSYELRRSLLPWLRSWLGSPEPSPSRPVPSRPVPSPDVDCALLSLGIREEAFRGSLAGREGVVARCSILKASGLGGVSLWGRERK